MNDSLYNVATLHNLVTTKTITPSIQDELIKTE